MAKTVAENPPGMQLIGQEMLKYLNRDHWDKIILGQFQVPFQASLVWYTKG
jgi:hypothetical protein